MYLKLKMNFKEHLETFLSKDETELIINSRKMPEIHCFMLNNNYNISINDLFNNSINLKKHPHIENAYIYDKEEIEFGKSLEFIAGAFYIQEPSSMMAVSLLNIQKDEKVLDMCAAPGGKSFNILNKLENTGLLIANDIHEIRSKILSANIEKYGFDNVIVLNDDSKHYKKHFKNYFNKIIIDAPCSGSAMFRKNKQAEEEWSIEKVYNCQSIQKSLIEDAYEMLAPEGEILYSTCSFSIQENEEVIEFFLNNHPDIEIVPISLNKLYNDTINIKGGLRLYPHKFEGEGQVIFILKKKREETPLNSYYKEIKTSKPSKDVLKFLNDIKVDINSNDIILFKNNYSFANFTKFDLYDVKINRYGMEIGTTSNNHFEPAHAFSKYFKMPQEMYIELNEDETREYLKGLTISKEGNSGYKIVTYKKIPLGWVKHVNNQLKNHYPKGLRLKF